MSFLEKKLYFFPPRSRVLIMTSPLLFLNFVVISDETLVFKITVASMMMENMVTF